MPAAAGIGIPTKYFRSGRPGLRGWANIESPPPRCPANQKEKADEPARLRQVLVQLHVDRIRQERKTPDVREKAGRDPESDHIRERIQFLAKIARGVGHPRNSAVQS